MESEVPNYYREDYYYNNYDVPVHYKTYSNRSDAKHS